MSRALEHRPIRHSKTVALLGIFANGRLQLYSYALVAIYGALLFSFYRTGIWLAMRRDSHSTLIFTTMRVAGIQALRGDVALLYDSQEFVRIQTELLGPTHDFYQNWPYPLLLMPLRSGNGDHSV